MRKKTVRFERYDGSFYERVYEETDEYCPSCGAQSLWVEDGDGDFYEGNEHVCASCGTSFHTNGLSKNEEAFQQLALKED